MRWFCFVCVGLEIVCKRARDQILVIGGGGGGWRLVVGDFKIFIDSVYIPTIVKKTNKKN